MVLTIAINQEDSVTLSFNTEADAEAVGVDTGSSSVINAGGYAFIYDASGADLTTGDGRTWTRVIPPTYADTAAILSNQRALTAGDILIAEKEGVAYEAAASGATDHHLTRNDGRKLYALPDARGAITARQIGITDGSNGTTKFTRFIAGRLTGITRFICDVDFDLASPSATGFTAASVITLEADNADQIGRGEDATRTIGMMNLIQQRADANSLTKQNALFDAEKFRALGIRFAHDVDVTPAEITGNGNGGAVFYATAGSGFYAEKCKADFLSGNFVNLIDHSYWRVSKCWTGLPFYAIYIRGSCDYGVYEDSNGVAGYQTNNSLGDFLKAAPFSTNGRGPRFIRIRGNHLVNPFRDGVDSTGGMHGWQVTHNVFDCVTGAIDAKQQTRVAGDVDAAEENFKGLVIANNVIRGSEIIITFNHDLAGYGSTPADYLLPQGVSATNNVFVPRVGRENCGYYFKGASGISVTGDNFTSYRLKPVGDFDPTSGSFPADALEGTYYTATGTATIDGLAITTGDFVVPKVDDASTSDSADWVIKDTAWLSCSMLRFDGGTTDGYSNQGSWDASGGAFPSATNDGDYYTVSVAGTVDDIAFAVGDFLVAQVDTPSTSVYDGNWIKRRSTFYPTPGKNVSFRNILWDARGDAQITVTECENVSLHFAELKTDHGSTITVTTSAVDVEITGRLEAERNEFNTSENISPIFLSTNTRVRIDLDATYNSSDGRSYCIECGPAFNPRVSLDGMFDGWLTVARFQGAIDEGFLGIGRGLHVLNCTFVLATASSVQKFTKGVLTLENLKNSVITNETGLLGNVLSLDPGQGAELTIASGEVTATNGVHLVDTEADAATDNLDTIDGGMTGDLLTLAPADGARTVTLRDRADSGGNIELGGTGQTRDLDETGDTVIIRKSAAGVWHEVAFYSVT